MTLKKTTQSPKLITIFGGSGFVGKHTVSLLAQKGYNIRIATRNPGKAHALTQTCAVGQIEIVKANVHYPESLEAATENADVIINLIGETRELRSEIFRTINVEGAENIAKIAEKKHLPLIHLSILGASETAKSFFVRSKGSGEKRVKAVHPKSIILRPSLIFGDEDGVFNRIADAIRFLPFIPLIESGKTKFQPVYVVDVVKAILYFVENPVSDKRVYELGGPDVLTLKQIFNIISDITGRKKRFIPIKDYWAYPFARFVEIISKIPSFPKSITGDYVLFLKTDNVVSQNAKLTARTLEGIGITPQAFQAKIGSCLRRFYRDGQFSKNVNEIKKNLK